MSIEMKKRVQIALGATPLSMFREALRKERSEKQAHGSAKSQWQLMDERGLTQFLAHVAAV